jgi:hypothetical protein
VSHKGSFPLEIRSLYKCGIFEVSLEIANSGCKQPLEVTTMKLAKACVLGLSITLIMTATAPLVFAQAAHVRWDLISLSIVGSTVTVNPGGIASASANDTSHITLTGSGTFIAPAGGDGTSSATTGGGTWEAFDPGATTPSASGTYSVTGLVRWEEAPGTFPATVDAVGDVAQAHSGLAVLRVEFSDGSHGVLTVSCHFNGTPNSVFEGITVSKGFVDYWNRQAPVGGVNANRTVFHVD